MVVWHGVHTSAQSSNLVNLLAGQTVMNTVKWPPSKCPGLPQSPAVELAT